MSVIGHTHRPLFESLTKYDRLRLELLGGKKTNAGAEIERRDREA